MKKMHSYSKRDLLDTCLRQYFYEYYAAAKRLPFDADRKPLVQELKGFTGIYLLAGEKLHWFIEQYLKRGASCRDWAERTCLASFDQAVRYSRAPELNEALRAGKYPPPMLLEFYYGHPRAEELAADARDALRRGIRHFLEAKQVSDVWRSVRASEHYVEKKIGGLPKFDGFGIDGKIDLAGRDDKGVRIADWKLGVQGSGHDSLQLLIYGLWARAQFAVEPEQVRVQRVFLGNATVEPERPLDGASMRAGKARLLQDIELMKELDAYGRAGIEEAFTPCQRENICRQCNYQQVCPDSGSGLSPRQTCVSLTVLPSGR